MIIPLIIFNKNKIDSSSFSELKKEIDSAIKLSNVFILDLSYVTSIDHSGFESILQNIYYLHNYKIFICGLKTSVASKLNLIDTNTKSKICTTSIDKVLNEVKGWCKRHGKKN